MPLESVGTPLLWGGFILFVLAILAIDLGIFNRHAHKISFKEAAVWSAVWVSLALLFNIGVYFWFGPKLALEFTTGYLIEKALSVDNIFVFILIFSYFSVPAIYQHRILFWGIIGALVMRAVFILLGGIFLQKFHWAIYVFGGILIVSGIKFLLQKSEEIHPEKNPVVRLFKKIFPLSSDCQNGHFTFVKAGKRYATPLLLTLVTVEVTDLIFAIDSIPAIFAVTRDPFIVFTSNIFAILGLRSLYFLLAGVMDKFHYLKIGLALVLIFVGAKMMLTEVFKLPIVASLGIIAGILGGSIVVSLMKPKISKHV